MAFPSAAHAAIDPLSGIDLARISAVGNAAWQGNGFPSDFSIGRGKVDYSYSIGKFEVTTAQWAEFMNAAFDRTPGDELPHVIPPSRWGAASVTPINGGKRFSVIPGRDMYPAGGISWRTAAMYCNWLSNDKGTDRDAFLNGAYDVSTFFSIGNVFQDQAAHTPGAKYWIPTYNEWLKAAHYDPNKVNGDGTTGGYWVYSNTSDTAPRSGKPPSQGGNGQANYGFSGGAFNIPLGAYTDVTSPWGLYDVAGGSNEWTESILDIGDGGNFRIIDGSYWDSGLNKSIADSIYSDIADRPYVPVYEHGFRIASSVVPAPTGCLIVFVAAWFTGREKRKGERDETREREIAP